MKVAAAGFSKPIVAIIAVLSLVLVSLVAAITVHLTGSKSASAEGTADSTDISIARNAYSEVLDSINAEQLPLLRAKTPTNVFTYALADATGDQQPELFVKHQANQEVSTIRVYSTTNDGKLIAPENKLYSGAADAGGGRYEIYADNNGNGFYQETGMSGTGAYSADAYTFNGQAVAKDPARHWEYHVNNKPAAFTNATAPLNFVPVSDRAPLESMGTTPAADAPAPNAAPAPAPAAEDFKPAPPAGDANTNVVTGTVRVMNAVEYMAFRNVPYPPPNGETNSDYVAILVLDQPTSVSGTKAGRPHTETVSKVGLGTRTSRYSYGEEWFAMDGQHVTLSQPVANTGFASGTDLPGGANFRDSTRL